MKTRSSNVLAGAILALGLALVFSKGVGAEIIYYPISGPGFTIIDYAGLLNPIYSNGNLVIEDDDITLADSLAISGSLLQTSGSLVLQTPLTVGNGFTSNAGYVSIGFGGKKPGPVPPTPGKDVLSITGDFTLGESMVSVGFGGRTPKPVPSPPGTDEMLISTSGSFKATGSTVSLVFGAKPQPLPAPGGNEWYASFFSDDFYSSTDFWVPNSGNLVDAMPNSLPSPNIFQVYDFAYIESSQFLLEDSAFNFDLNNLGAAYGDVFLLGLADSISIKNVRTNLPDGWGFFLLHTILFFMGSCHFLRTPPISFPSPPHCFYWVSD